MPYGFNEDKSKYDLTDDLGDIASLDTRVTALENDFIVIDSSTYQEAGMWTVKNITVDYDPDEYMIVSVSQIDAYNKKSYDKESWVSNGYYNPESVTGDSMRAFPSAEFTPYSSPGNRISVYVYNNSDTNMSLKFRVLLKKLPVIDQNPS